MSLRKNGTKDERPPPVTPDQERIQSLEREVEELRTYIFNYLKGCHIDGTKRFEDMGKICPSCDMYKDTP